MADEIETEMHALAHADGSTQHDEPGHQVQRQRFRPTGRVVEDVAGEDLPADDRRHGDETQA
ncbi:hypothetical protein D3C71_2151590 [compost metagenome]